MEFHLVGFAGWRSHPAFHWVEDGVNIFPAVDARTIEASLFAQSELCLAKEFLDGVGAVAGT